MRLEFQPKCILNYIVGTPLKVINLSLLLFSLGIVPAFATGGTLIVGTMFDKDNENRDFYYQGIDSAREAYSNITIERGDYSSTCDNAAQKTERLINEKSVQVILSVKENGCSSKIGEVAKRFRNVLHIRLVFLVTDFSFSSPWLSVELSSSSPEQTYIVLMPKEEPGDSTKNLIFVIQQLYTTFIGGEPKLSQQTYKIRVPFAPLRKKPARPGVDSEEDSTGVNKIILKDGDLVEGNAVINDPNHIENHCKRDMEKDLIYDYVYTMDWICVKVIKSSHDSYQGKTGWIHRMLVE